VGLTHTIELPVSGKRVTFGKLLKGRDWFALDSDPQASDQTQYNDLVMRAEITQFGKEKMPVTLKTLLELTSVDREVLEEGHTEFQRLWAEGKEAKFLSDGRVRMAFGYARNGLVYDIAVFGKLHTGMDEVQANKQKLNGLKRICYLMGREIVKLAQSDGASELAGPVELEVFEELDGADILTLRSASAIWRSTFRRNGKALQGKRSGAGGLRADGGDASA
jgi:hypothetical protein